MPDISNEILIKITLQNQEFLNQLKATQKQTQKTSESLMSSFKGVGAMLGGVTIVGALQYLRKETEEAQKNFAKLTSVINSTGGSSGVTAKEAQALAQKLSGLTAVDDDLIIGAEAVLLRFSKIGKEVFPEATQAALDLSAATGKDLNAAALLVGKAYNDPIKGITLLKKAGVEFNETLIQQKMALGDVAGAQKLVTEGLNRAFGGQAAAQANTLAGNISKIEIAMGNMAAQIGDAATPAVAQLAAEIEKSSPQQQELVKNLGTILSGAIKAIPYIIEMGKAVYNMFMTITGAKFLAVAFDSIKSDLAPLGNKAGQIWGYFFGESAVEAAKKQLVALDPIMSNVLKATGGKWITPPGKNLGSGGGEDKAKLAEQEQKNIFNFMKRNLDDQEKLELEYNKAKEDLLKSRNLTFQQMMDASIGIEEAYADKSADIKKKQADEILKGVGQVLSSATQLFSGIGQLMQQQTDQELIQLDNKAQIGKAFIDALTQEKLKAAGVEDQTETQKVNKSIATLQKQIAKEKNIKKKKELQDLLALKLDEKKKLKVQTEAAEAQYLLDLLISYRKNIIAKKNFENQKAMSIASIWLSAGVAVLGAWAGAFQTTPMPIAAAIIAGIMTALILAMAGVQTGIVASQTFTPIYHTGSYNVPTTGPAILEGGEIITPKPLADSIRSGEAVLGTPDAGAGGLTVIVQGNVYDERGFKKVLNGALRTMNRSAYA